jgi:very-short-patch-repair endonuclease
VDGDIHDLQKEEDARREKALSALGLRVVRFRNDEVVRELSAVVGRIREFILHPSKFILALSAGEGFVRVGAEDCPLRE